MSSHRIVVISGGNGASGEQLARTALAQFPGSDVEVVISAGIRDADDLRKAVDVARTSDAIVVHTLVDSALRSELTQLAERSGLVAIDSMGPLLDTIASRIDRQPIEIPGRYRQIREDYFRRIEAIDFAVKHDDGKRVDELHLASIVLIGVSRTGKTPLSMFLAMRGYKTANVPLILGVEPPNELFRVDRRRVVSLTVDPEQLVTIRRRRQVALGRGVAASYSDPKQILRDLEHARQITRRGRFASIDVSLKPIEESASDVIASVGSALP
jgi:regulator of PEP synthase PpsR (kinase-PPPase family)